MYGLRKNAKTSIFGHFGAKMDNFGQFLAKMGKTGIYFKKALGTFFWCLQALTNCKFQKKVMKGFRETA